MTYRNAFWIMMFVPISLGAGFPLIKAGMQHLSLTNFIFLRFSVATLFMMGVLGTFFFRRQLMHIRPALILSGIVLGIVNFSASYFQSQGLLTIASGQSAFLTGANVVLVPFFLQLFRLEPLRILHLFQAAICLAGIFLLSGAANEGSLHFSAGTLWTLLSAVSFASMVVLFEWCARHYGSSSILVFFQMLTTVLVAGPIAAYKGELIFPLSGYAWIFIVSCGILAALALWLQARYQSQVGALKSTIIMSLQGFYAFLFASLFFGETISFIEIAGATLIFLSIALPKLNDFLLLKRNMPPFSAETLTFKGWRKKA